jgi:uncharacterized membrane protein
VTALAITLALVCQVLLVTGQVLLKHAMAPATAEVGLRGMNVRNLGLGIASMTGWFLLWIALLQRWELSQVFPFEGLAPALLVVAARVFLKEKLPPIAWAGIALITIGTVLVSGS